MKKISDKLREAREEKGMALSEIEGQTKIKEEFLKAIEEGNFDVLPSESYALGFVKNYAKFLGIPEGQSVPLFRREYKARHGVHIVPEFRKSQHKFNRQFLFNSKTMIIIFAVLILGVYIFFQYSSLIFAPQLELMSPKNGAEISGSVTEVKGKTDAYATVSVNGEEAYVNLQGNFRKSVYIFSGNNKIEVKAKNRFGKETIKIISVKTK